MTYITTHPQLRSNRAAVWLWAVVLLSALAWLGHRLVFAQFQDYDDEGYLLLTVQQFLRGLPVYDEIYTQYGPAYYLWQQVLHTLLGIPVTHDATRVVTVVVWLVCAGLVGTIVWLLTKRPLLAAIGTAVAFLHLTQLTFEPGHPQELCLLSALGAVALATWRLVAKKHLGTAGSIGVWVLVAVTALTKINVGAFLAAALTLGFVTGLGRSRWQTVVERIVLAAAMAAVPALMRGDLLRSDIAASVVVVWCGLLAAFISGSGDAADEGVVTVRDLVAGVSAFAIGCAVLVAVIVYQGSSLRSLFEGLFVAPLLLPKVFWRPLPVPVLLAAVAPAMLIAAWCWQRGMIARQRWVDFAALACGLIMFLLSTSKSYQMLFAAGPLLAWLVLADRSSGAEQRAARRILAFAAIFMMLQAYPMPDGTQIVLGTVLFVPLALVMIAGAQRTFGSREGSRGTQWSFGRGALLAALGVAGVANIGIPAQRFYARGIPLELPGARSVRTTARNASTYWWLSANVRDHCDRFITAPGLNSLHFWTEIPPVSTLNTTLWPLLFDVDQQRRILAAAAPVERLCVVWAPKPMGVLTSAPEVASRPLFAWLLREFEPRARVGDWELHMRRGRRPTTVYGGRWVDDGGIALDLPSIGHETVARVAVVDVDSDRTLSDSARGEQAVVLDEDGARIRVDSGIEVSRPRRIVVRPAIEAALSFNRQSLAVRLWARDGRSMAIVPIVDDAAPDRVFATGGTRQ
jgi:hypothetical protein